MNAVNVLAKFEIRSFTHSSDSRGCPKIGQSLYMPMLPFLTEFLWAFVRMDLVIVLAKFEVSSFTRSRDNSYWSFGFDFDGVWVWI